jgi:hypothetical protein
MYDPRDHLVHSGPTARKAFQISRLLDNIDWTLRAHSARAASGVYGKFFAGLIVSELNACRNDILQIRQLLFGSSENDRVPPS